MIHFKKPVFGLFIFLMLLSLNALTQELEKKGYFSIGAEGGVQLTNIKGFSGYRAVSKVGYNVGVFGEYYISNDFKVRLGAYYDNRKFGLELSQPYLVNKIDDTIYASYKSYYFYQVDYSLNYLTLPLGINYTKGNEKFKILIQLNVYYSILIGSNRKGIDDYFIHPDDAQYFIDVGSFEDRNFIPGDNITEYNGSTDGASFDQDRIHYLFDTYDFGMNFIIGGVYNVTPRLGISASVGFTLGFANLFQEQRLETKWSQVTKFNLGIVYLLEKKNKRFGTN